MYPLKGCDSPAPVGSLDQFYRKGRRLKALSPEQCLVVIPTYNEADNIRPLIQRIVEVCRNLHILVIDDNSQDGTAELVKQLQKTHPQLHLLERSGKLGLGTAYIAGFKWAMNQGYEACVEMDADFSHDPQMLPSMINQLNVYDAVIGSRYIPGGGTENWNPFRKLISRFGSLYARLILGMSLRDMTGGFNAWRRKVLQTIDLDDIRSEGYSFQIELKYRAFRSHFKLIEIPILFSERREGQSKMSSRIVLEAFIRVWAFRFHKLATHKPAELLDTTGKIGQSSKS